KRAVDFLAERVKPAKGGVDHRRIEQLILDLDDDKFATREQATQELEKIGGPAEAARKRTLNGAPSLGGRRRGERVREEVEGGVGGAADPRGPGVAGAHGHAGGA